MGKSAIAVSLAKEIKPRRCLIVCPAIVRSKWETKEIEAFWPGHPMVGVIKYGRSVKLDAKEDLERNLSYLAPIQIVSYHLVDEVGIGPWDLIVIDEAHRAKNARTGWSKTLRSIVEANPNAAVLALTATPMADKPQDIHNILDILWPGRFGSRFRFQERYQLYETNEFATSGKKFYGVNPVHSLELRKRIAAVSSRTTKAEIAHLLPPFDVDVLRVKVGGKKSVINAEADVWAALYSNGIEKIPMVTEWAEDALESSTHISILTHHRDLANRIKTALEHRQDVPVYLATGEVGAEKRNEILAMAKDAPRAIVVATIDAIGIGIDMTFTPQALFAELSYKLEAMIQALGRFSRLSGTVPSSCKILVAEGTIDEVIASKLEEKVKATNEAIKAGASESMLAASLGIQSGDDWLTELKTSIMNITETNEYL